jgi:hypothetical protein
MAWSIDESHSLNRRRLREIQSLLEMTPGLRLHCHSGWLLDRCQSWHSLFLIWYLFHRLSFIVYYSDFLSCLYWVPNHFEGLSLNHIAGEPESAENVDLYRYYPFDAKIDTEMPST